MACGCAMGVTDPRDGEGVSERSHLLARGRESEGGLLLAEFMNGRVLSEVRATVDPSHADDLLAGFHALLAQPRPDGLLRTELLRAGNEWRIQTLWRDSDALSSMRSTTEEPAAPRLFRAVGAQPELAVLEVELSTED